MSAVRAALLAGLIVSTASGAFAQTAGEVVRSEAADFMVETVAGGLDSPWGLAFLPDGCLLVTEQPGRLRRVCEGQVGPPIAGVPQVRASGQGGMLDVALAPDFEQSGRLYLTYSHRGEGGTGTRLASARLEGETLSELRVLFDGHRAGGGRHFGSRIAFDGEGHVFVTLGERGDPPLSRDVGVLAGKVVRLTEAGGVPADNPLRDRPGARPEIWSYGHRNPQGLVYDAESGRLWAVEHGPRGGDELNLVRPGADYGWPEQTYGLAYSGLEIGEDVVAGTEQPVHYWVPSISPSGLAIYRGEAFPGWRGDLLLGALSGRAFVRLDMDGAEVLAEERMLQGELGRIRDVRVGPDGLVYLLTDSSDGAVLRLRPVAGRQGTE